MTRFKVHYTLTTCNAHNQKRLIYLPIVSIIEWYFSFIYFIQFSYIRYLCVFVQFEFTKKNIKEESDTISYFFSTRNIKQRFPRLLSYCHFLNESQRWRFPESFFFECNFISFFPLQINNFSYPSHIKNRQNIKKKHFFWLKSLMIEILFSW